MIRSADTVSLTAETHNIFSAAVSMLEIAHTMCNHDWWDDAIAATLLPRGKEVSLCIRAKLAARAAALTSTARTPLDACSASIDTPFVPAALRADP